MFEDLKEAVRETSGESESTPETARQILRTVKRQSRRRVSAEDKTRIVMEGLRGELSIADLCRRENITKMAYYRWLKSFLEGGKKRLLGDHLRDANTDEVEALRQEGNELKRLVAELLLENRRLKKSLRE